MRVLTAPAEFMRPWPVMLRVAWPTVSRVVDEARAEWAGREFVFTDEPVWNGKPIVIGSRK